MNGFNSLASSLAPAGFYWQNNRKNKSHEVVTPLNLQWVQVLGMETHDSELIE